MRIGEDGYGLNRKGERGETKIDGLILHTEALIRIGKQIQLQPESPTHLQLGFGRVLALVLMPMLVLVLVMHLRTHQGQRDGQGQRLRLRAVQAAPPCSCARIGRDTVRIRQGLGDKPC